MQSLGPEQILNSFWNNNYDTLFELCSSGKSGSLFYYTFDKKYMLKTIPKREFDVFKAALEKYYAMIKRNPNSLISKFYGLHSVVFDDDKGRRQ